jgi:hypothetical protein
MRPDFHVTDPSPFAVETSLTLSSAIVMPQGVLAPQP